MEINIMDALAAQEKDSNFLKSLPAWTKITGLRYKAFNAEVAIEKRGGYAIGWGLDGVVGRSYSSYWYVAGGKERFIEDALRKLVENTEKYEVRS